LMEMLFDNDNLPASSQIGSQETSQAGRPLGTATAQERVIRQTRRPADDSSRSLAVHTSSGSFRLPSRALRRLRDRAGMGERRTERQCSLTSR